MRSLLVVASFVLFSACQAGSSLPVQDAADDPGAADALPSTDGAAKDPGPQADTPPVDVAVDPGAPDVTPDPGSPDEPADPEPADVAPDPGAPDAADEADVADVEADVPASTLPDPDHPGPWTVATITGSVVRGSRTTPVVAHVPQRTDGLASPLVVFLPGFQAKAAWYASSIDRLASHGFVVVGADPPGGLFDVNHVEMAADVSAVLDWALDAGGPLAGLLEPGRVGLTGHSLGGKVATMAAHADARVTALLALDPVNGGNPVTGYSPTLPDIVPSQVATLAIPVGFQGETPSAQGKSAFSPACSPTDQNFMTFFGAASASPWRAAWDLLGAGHMDFVDGNSACGLACTLCVRGDAAAAAVLAASQTLLVAFYRRHFLADAAMEVWLTGAKLPAGVAVVHAP